MEVSNGPKVQAAEVPARAANAAAPVRNELAAKVQAVEIKAPPKAPEFEGQDLDKAVKDLQEFVDSLDRSLSFKRDESINRSIITVRDTNTNQLVRQIPAEEVVEIARQMREDLDAKRAGMLLRGEA